MAVPVWADLEAEAPTGHRLCRGCLRIKPNEEFTVRVSPSGEQARSRCRSCVSARWQEDRELNLARKAACNYGITAEQYVTLMASGCHVCGHIPAPTDRRLHVDHCHETGTVRGALCHSCNTALGLADESPDRLRALAEYLDHHRAVAA